MDLTKKLHIIVDVKNFAGTENIIDLIKSQEILIKKLRTGVEKIEVISSGKKIENAIHQFFLRP